MVQNNNLSNSDIIKNYIPIVLCAGFGTRLRPITNIIPKVICPIIDKPLAFYNIEKFFKFGFEHVYCNTHYLPDLVESEIKACAKHFGYDPKRIIFFHEKEILGSGGGILNIISSLRQNDPSNHKKDAIIVSGDVVADFSIEDMINRWDKKSGNDKALMLSLALDIPRDDVLCVSEDGKIVIGFGKTFIDQNSEIKPQKRLFSNHQIIASNVFDNIPISSDSSVSLFYKKILNTPEQNIIHEEYSPERYWFNVGDVEEYNKCLQYFCEKDSISYPPVNYMHSISDEIGKSVEMISLQSGIQIKKR